MTDKRTTDHLVGLLSGFNQIIWKLITDLDARGIISKQNFADEIERGVAGKSIKEGDELRFDRLLIQNLVKLLREQHPLQPDEWKPEVIQGGLTDPKDDGNSGQ
jgi:hypothetical protein